MAAPPLALHAPGALLLVSCYELGHQPWNLASPLAWLRAAAFAPVAVDTSVEPLEEATIRAAQLVAISVPMHTALRLGVAVAERVRCLNPEAQICFFGLYAWLNRAWLLPGRGDWVIGGEYEAPLVALAEALAAGRDPSRVPGVGSAHHESAPHLARLPFLPPAREQLPPFEHYARFRDAEGEALAGYVEATRGCLHRCRHCPITPVYEGRFFVVPREVVLADVRRQVAAGARHITFGDPDFLNGPGHALALLRALHEEFPALTFDVTIKVEHLLEHRALLPTLRDLGCAFVVSAVESFSDLVLAQLDKGHSGAEAREAIALCAALGLPLRPTFVAFTPWTTLDDFIEALHSVEALGISAQVDPVQWSIRLLVPPGSTLAALPDAAAWLGPLDAANFTHRWAHPDPRMDALHRAISGAVEEGARLGEPPSETFQRLKKLAYEAAGRPLPLPMELPPQPVVPGLTESWFC